MRCVPPGASEAALRRERVDNVPIDVVARA